MKVVAQLYTYLSNVSLYVHMSYLTSKLDSKIYVFIFAMVRICVSVYDKLLYCNILQTIEHIRKMLLILIHNYHDIHWKQCKERIEKVLEHELIQQLLQAWTIDKRKLMSNYIQWMLYSKNKLNLLHPYLKLWSVNYVLMGVIIFYYVYLWYSRGKIHPSKFSLFERIPHYGFCYFEYRKENSKFHIIILYPTRFLNINM